MLICTCEGKVTGFSLANPKLTGDAESDRQCCGHSVRLDRSCLAHCVITRRLITMRYRVIGEKDKSAKGQRMFYEPIATLRSASSP
jgi:hypothetical protein